MIALSATTSLKSGFDLCPPLAQFKLMNPFIKKLLWLSHEIGREDRHLAILGEGNTSADAGDGTFWIKASGGNLAALAEEDLTPVRFDAIAASLDDTTLDDSGVREVLLASRSDANAKLPSVETFMHAVCLQEGGAQWIGHCHPVSVLQILCSRQGAAPFLQHVFPDEIVVCGRHLGVVPYIDPGIELARAVRSELRRFREEYGGTPKVILLVNHGPVALGQSEREVLNILLMLDKWARILVGNFALGGPEFLPEKNSTRIDTRPDEHYRRAQIAAQQ
jgi:rhamnose utilization protein RhaD (predicted bifunctional aldolase and dehydrogenase)